MPSPGEHPLMDRGCRDTWWMLVPRPKCTDPWRWSASAEWRP